MRVVIAAISFAMLAGVAQADLLAIRDRAAFLRIVQGKEITGPLINLSVTSDGRITGKGARWPVSGTWRWKGGYFCRDLFWGGDALGYNCQEVKAARGRIRFTSDKGAGQSAVFRLK